MVLVTHDVFQAKRLAHRTALMIGGRIVELAETADFFAAPQQRDTAAFLNGELVGAGPPPESAPARRRSRKRRLAAGG